MATSRWSDTVRSARHQTLRLVMWSGWGDAAQHTAQHTARRWCSPRMHRPMCPSELARIAAVATLCAGLCGGRRHG